MSFSRWSELAALGVSTVHEASGREGLLELPWIQLIPRSRVAGPVRTVRCGQADNLMVHAVIEWIRPGEVVVFVMPEPRPQALLGEILAIQAQRQGAAALLFDAAIRDADELRELGLPVWTRWISSHGPGKRVWGAIDEPVEIAGVEIRPGDGLVLDADGAVVIRQERLDGVLAASQARAAKEEALRPKLRQGAFTYDLHGLREAAETLRPGPG